MNIQIKYLHCHSLGTSRPQPLGKPRGVFHSFFNTASLHYDLELALRTFYKMQHRCYYMVNGNRNAF